MKIKFDLLKALKIHGYKQKEVSEKTGLSKVAINNICTGKTSPKIEKIILIAEKMNIPMEDFFEIENKETQNGTQIKCPHCHRNLNVKLEIQG